MRKHRYALGATFASLAIVVLAACQGNTTGGSQSGGATSNLKIGLVTDVGQLNDRNFNQYSWEGAQDGASKVGGTPKALQSTVSADIAKNVQSFVDQKYDIIVTVGFAAGGDTIKAAKANPSVKFIGVDQSPCVDAQAKNDPTFACKGDAGKLLPNLQGIQWKEQQPGYLAGIVAASISKSGHIAAVGGTASVPAVPNYMIGYLNGARSVNPNVKVDLKYVSAAPDAKAFNDPPGGKAFAQQMLQQSPDIDVMFQVAGATGNGVLQAACAANIHAIGVDVDQHISSPESASCIVTSAEKFLKKNVSDAIVRIKDKKDKAGTVKLDISTDDVGLAPFYDFDGKLITDAIKKKVADATAAMKSGSLKACNENQFGGCNATKDGQPA
jgi:basic membrane protein A and related proteins